jgi:hypothetical protein
MTAKQHIMYALRASGPYTHEDLQNELLVQCAEANLDNVEQMVSTNLVELLNDRHIVEYSDNPKSWDVNYDVLEGEELDKACGD